MVTEDGPKVLEYNVRFGDPETEALMLLLTEDTDLAEVALVCPWHSLSSLFISSLKIFRLAQNTDWIPLISNRNQVLPSLSFSPPKVIREVIQEERRSPLDPSLPVSPLDRVQPLSTHIIPTDVVVFHAGTARSNDKVFTSGGRVLAVSAHAETLQAALDAAYTAVENVRFDGKTYRRDIAHRLFWY